VNPEDLEGARDSDGQTNRRTYDRKESQHILNLLTPTTARAQKTVRNSTSARCQYDNNLEGICLAVYLDGEVTILAYASHMEKETYSMVAFT
jgi:hypothetical protein